MPIPIDLAFIDPNGRPQLLHVVTAEGHGWSVHASFDGRTFTRECSDWQHVERARGWLQSHAPEATSMTTGRSIAGRPTLAAGLAAVS